MSMWDGFRVTAGMDSTPNEEEDVILRNSTVGAWDLCPGRVGYALDEGFIKTPSEAMSFGTMDHAAIEIDLLNGTHLWTMDEMEALWVKSLKDEPAGPYDLYELATMERIRSSVQEAVVSMAAFQQDVWPQLNLGVNLLIEEKLWAPLGVLPNGRSVWFHGTPDLVDTTNMKITDWKTSGKGWKPTKADGLYGPQAYSFLVKENYDLFINDHEFYVYDRKAQTWEFYPQKRNEADVDAYLRKVWMIAKSIDAQAFPFQPWSDTFGNVKRGWHCSPRYCGAWNICEGKALPDDVFIGSKIEVSEGWA